MQKAGFASFPTEQVMFETFSNVGELRMVKAGKEKIRRAYVIDDDSSLSQAIEMCLNTIDVESKAYLSAESFLNDVTADPDGCLIVDIQLQGNSGIQLLRSIRKRGWTVPAIVVSGTLTVSTTLDAVEFGAIDVLEKPMTPQKLWASVEAALASRRSDLIDIADLKNRMDSLTKIENKVLKFMIDGRVNKSIAYRLDLGLRTVVRHRKSILRKLSFKTIPEMVRALTLAGIGIPRFKKLLPARIPLPQQLRTDFRSKLNRQIRELREQTERLPNGDGYTAAVSVFEEIATSLSAMAEDPCLVSPSELAGDNCGLPVVIVISEKEQDGLNLACSFKLSGFYSETVKPDELKSSLLGYSEPPTAIVINGVKDVSHFAKLAHYLEQQNEEVPGVNVFVVKPDGEQGDLHRVLPPKYISGTFLPPFKPVDLVNSVLDCLAANSVD